MDGDATAEFRLVNFRRGPFTVNDFEFGGQIEARFGGNVPGAEWVKVTNGSALERLSAGTIVGSGLQFGGTLLNAQTAYIYSGNTAEGFDPTPAEFGKNPQWSVGQPGFFGFKFTRDAQTYYGWGQMEIDLLNSTGLPASGYGFKITDAYYQTTPNTSVTVSVVPEPSSIALLGMGAAGVAAWRARRKYRDRAEPAAAPPSSA